MPWEKGVAHVIADVYNPDGSPSQESPRRVLKRVIEQFGDLSMRPTVGPELEFYVLERTDKNPTGWQRYGEATGNVYVAGLKGDPENVLLRTLRHLSAYGLEVVAASPAEFAAFYGAELAKIAKVVRTAGIEPQ